MLLRLLKQNKLTLLYGASLAALLFLLKWLELKLLILNNSLEIYIGAIAILFTLLGIWLAGKLSSPRKKEPEIISAVSPLIAASPLNQSAIDALGLSKRELEVLQGMAEGLSNQEIADRLFVSLNTVKTHNSRLFEKLDVKRRTQAVEKAKRLQMIA
ncbi:response regulator transcription factor [Pseudoflavitalea rhizosphaerae]|uniref:response regulator transcription factor n=1 Tax=Pseudoflavitalea rhizosphaerae TaxID=1884793 RepID=UPI000F8C7865|nr:response regulator transcription factor [Pseudoflavitalea rhizosphaerae]